ncbi:hypothetical protein B0H14DRAFT_2725200, partial [Mycena olivaceomarginata]
MLPNFDLEVWSGLRRLPHLTHLVFNSYLQMCLALLPAWESLRALVILPERNTGEPLLELNNVPELAQDVRFLIIVCSNYREDWVKGATLDRDYWSRAEDFMVKRKSREINHKFVGSNSHIILTPRRAQPPSITFSKTTRGMMERRTREIYNARTALWSYQACLTIGRSLAVDSWLLHSVDLIDETTVSFGSPGV